MQRIVTAFVAAPTAFFLGGAVLGLPASANTITGSGVVISAGGDILTASHVVDSCERITVRFASKELEAAQLVARDQKNDLAVLRIRNSPPSAAAFREGTPLRAGDSVVALGYPLPSLLATSASLTVGYVSALTGYEDDSRYLQMSAPVQPGNSGGPLLDSSGHLAGIVISKLNAVSVAQYTGDIPQNVNFAIKAEVARAFLDSKGIAYRTARSDQALSPADVGDVARPSAVFVECQQGSGRSAAVLPPSSRAPQSGGNPTSPSAPFTDGSGGRTFQQVRWCEGADGASPDQQIDSCSALIQSGTGSKRNLATWFNNRGIGYKAKGDLDHAIADYDQAIRFDPDYAPAFNSRGVAYKAKGDLDRAIADYDQVIRLSPNSAPAFNNRGYAYFTKKSYDRAVADYGEALKLDPRFALALNNRGYAYFVQKDYDRAITDYDRAIGLDPLPMMASVSGGSHVNIYVNRGVAYAFKGDFDHAIADYDQAIRLDPKSALAFSNRGHAYRRKGNFERAISDYNEALRLDPKDASLYVDRGFVYFLRADFPAAEADLQRSFELDQGVYPMLWRYLARARSGNDGKEELAANAAHLKAKEWPYPVVEFYLGKRSAGDLSSVAAKPEQRCEAQFYLGEWHLLHSDSARATRTLRIAEETCPRDFYEYGGAVAELNRLDQ
jgi:tetratricopeptide (TPR) repeat protein